MGCGSPDAAGVAGAQSFAAVCAGDAYTCALTTEGRAFCWGPGNRNELGRPVGVCNPVAGFSNLCSPVPAHGELRFTTISASSAVTCGTPAAGGHRFAALAGGAMHVCGVTGSGAALCWGSGRDGQLGAGPMLP